MAVLAIAVLLSAMALGGRLILPRIGTIPIILSSEPNDAAQEVATRIQPVLRFNVPMNPRTIERALHIDPPISARLLWDQRFTTLTIVPLDNLRPATRYQITLETQALSQQLVPLQQAVSRSFQTAQAPAVLTLLPKADSAEVPVTSPLVIQFSRPMVAQSELGQARLFPSLHLSPETPGMLTWIATDLALFRPDSPLAAATRYRAVLSETLSDVQGETLERAASWEFTTAIPKVVSVAPANGARLIASTAPLTLTLSQAISPLKLSRMLTISPTLEGKLESSLLPNGTQLITFTPSLGWQRGTSYTASFTGGTDLPAITSTRWRFDIAPAPTLIGRYPGEGQTLALGQDVRLIFSTAMSAQKLQAALTLDPPADYIQVSSIGTEARVSAKLHAATSYTLTLPADLADANGSPLGQTYHIHFRTPPAQPELVLLQSDPHFVQYAPNQTATLKLGLTNVSALSLALYDLDEATLVRAAGFDESDWSLFQPERYNRPLRRAWTEALTQTVNLASEYQLRLEDKDNKPLPAGAYYLRLRSPDGPRADVVLLISRTRLNLQLTAHTGLVWATDVLSASVRAGEPIAVYQDDALVLESTTNAQGLLTFIPSAGAVHRYTILTRGEQLALVRSEALSLAFQTGRGRYRATVLTNRGSYATGDTIQLNGFVRQVITETLHYAPKATPVTLRLTDGVELHRPVRGSQEQSTQLLANGVLSSTFSLSRDILPGNYTLITEIAGQRFSTAVQLLPASDPKVQLNIELPDHIDNTGPVPARIRLTDASGMPHAGMPISWTLTAEPVLAALPEGFAAALPQPTLPQAIHGAAMSDAAGQALLSIMLPEGRTGLLRYRLLAEVQTANGISRAEALTRVNTLASYVGMRPQQQLLRINEQLRVDLMSFDQDGLAKPNTAMGIEIVRLLDDREQSVLRRTLSTDAQGRSQFALRLAEGRYQVRAWAQDTTPRLISRSTITVYQEGPGIALPSASMQPDQPEYQVGDTARLLLNTAAGRMLTLTTLSGPSRVDARVREISQGEALTVTLSKAELTQAQLHVLALNTDGTTGPWLFAQSLALRDPAETLTVSLEVAQQPYLPGSTALLTVTTRTSAGKPAPADLIVALVDANEDQPAAPQYASAEPLLLYSYTQPQAVSSQTSTVALARPLPQSLAWHTAVQTNAQGNARLALPLPASSARLRVLVWAASPSAIGFASAGIQLDRSSTIRMELPAFVRTGDQLLITAQPDSIDVSRAFSVTLQADAALIQTTAISQTIAPNQPASWPITIQAGSQLGLQLHLGSSAGLPQLLSLNRPILSNQSPVQPEASRQASQVYVLRSYLDPVTGQVLDTQAFKLGQILQLRLTLINLRTLEDISIDEAFAAGLLPIQLEQSSQLRLGEINADHLRLHADQLLPGIYEYHYLVRASFPGRYTQPAVWLRSASEGIQIESTPELVHILP